jgi:hypothetical protein
MPVGIKPFPFSFRQLGLHSLHIATALVVSFLGELAVELAAFHLTTAWQRRVSNDPRKEKREEKTNRIESR